tara:strand:- start:3088 stop:3543 length:456 start_codon:yes stop_codon:yes gene_type:complete
MGILAFISISFLLIIPEGKRIVTESKQLKFEWVGAPAYVKPIFFSCYENKIEYYNFFENRHYILNLDQLLQQIQGEDSKILNYLIQILELNFKIKKQFGKTEYFPLLLVYPEGILTSELLMTYIEKIQGLNFGIEPMLPNLEIPYQGIFSK